LSRVFASFLGRKNELAMLLRRQLDGESSRERLIWGFPALGTKRQIVLDGVGECLTEFIDGLPLERHHIPDVDDLSMEMIRLLIEGNVGETSLMA
jgi:hypothetical protein